MSADLANLSTNMVKYVASGNNYYVANNVQAGAKKMQEYQVIYTPTTSVSSIFASQGGLLQFTCPPSSNGLDEVSNVFLELNITNNHASTWSPLVAPLMIEHYEQDTNNSPIDQVVGEAILLDQILHATRDETEVLAIEENFTVGTYAVTNTVLTGASATYRINLSYSDMIVRSKLNPSLVKQQINWSFYFNSLANASLAANLATATVNVTSANLYMVGVRYDPLVKAAIYKRFATGDPIVHRFYRHNWLNYAQVFTNGTQTTLALTEFNQSFAYFGFLIRAGSANENRMVFKSISNASLRDSQGFPVGGLVNYSGTMITRDLMPYSFPSLSARANTLNLYALSYASDPDFAVQQGASEGYLKMNSAFSLQLTPSQTLGVNFAAFGASIANLVLNNGTISVMAV